MLEDILLAHHKMTYNDELYIKYGDQQNSAGVSISKYGRVWTIQNEDELYLVLDLGGYTMKIPAEQIQYFIIND